MNSDHSVFSSTKASPCNEAKAGSPEHAPDKLRCWNGAGLRWFAQRLLLMAEGGKAIILAVRGDRNLKMSSGLFLTQSHELVLKAVG